MRSDFPALFGILCLSASCSAMAAVQVSGVLDATQLSTVWPASEMAKLSRDSQTHAMATGNSNILTPAADINGYAEVSRPYSQVPASKSIGRLFFRRQNGERGSCSASVVHAPQHDLLLTAGHCVRSGLPSQWNKDFAFVPAYDGSAVAPSPLGVWPGIQVAALDDGSQPGLDVAAIKVQGGIEEKTGGLSLVFKERPLENTFTGYLVGYPNSGYDGKSMLRCLGRWTVQPIVNGQFVSSNCGPKGGNSGGPILLQENGDWQAKVLGIVTDGSKSNKVLNAGGVPVSIEQWDLLAQALHHR
ncbi:trypsin-like serine peptidase [Chromobacterium vaccinii]|uniref:trypsin-like serine peptidase n=1 Tax=Chromobacterium TaxID=535 RepID=UPI001F3B3D22|nr:trypsin-like peptidase domain-containing protein [Chromobacterium sp. ATCC 53434]